MTIMIDGCQNCHQSKSDHMPDGACLFEPTQYKAYPRVFVTYRPIGCDDDVPHVQLPSERYTWWSPVKKFWRSFFGE